MLRQMPLPSLRHVRLIARLATLLRAQLPSDRFEVLDSAFGQVIRREPFTYRIPDLGVYRCDQLTDDHYIWAVPELLVEVISPTNRKNDIEDRIRDYQELGVPELWLIEIDQRQVISRGPTSHVLATLGPRLETIWEGS